MSNLHQITSDTWLKYKHDIFFVIPHDNNTVYLEPDLRDNQGIFQINPFQMPLYGKLITTYIRFWNPARIISVTSLFK